MKFNTLLLIVVLVLLAVLAVLNLDSLLFGHTLRLGFATYERVPLGMILLITAGVLALLFSLLTSVSHLRAEADQARTLREMQTLRQSLDSAEASRFTQLQAYLEGRLNDLQARTADMEGVNARVDRVRDELSADIGELEDYLRRKLGDERPPLTGPSLTKS
ncbi:LapA family protein [Deinococcus maricopensis]|jgi:uncharacterized integral membrane protein|uniref:Lipopolysaccharide assembly protein A domain-containing protein n=1 Tax=Deinococcus maricopensis (strain DSM 21211 / LMG 22137 / NRRL B-23946 / LB-34) TaxID=709986 RepID=E8U5S4_DEIML|nr:LapA family protein [Deinococcus maricopensis]ADV66413.1 hypothetical protein Deima_0757 [Deinococcus maricopensis DSM 21211]